MNGFETFLTQNDAVRQEALEKAAKLKEMENSKLEPEQDGDKEAKELIKESADNAKNDKKKWEYSGNNIRDITGNIRSYLLKGFLKVFITTFVLFVGYVGLKAYLPSNQTAQERLVVDDNKTKFVSSVANNQDDWRNTQEAKLNVLRGDVNSANTKLDQVSQDINSKFQDLAKLLTQNSQKPQKQEQMPPLAKVLKKQPNQTLPPPPTVNQNNGFDLSDLNEKPEKSKKTIQTTTYQQPMQPQVAQAQTYQQPQQPSAQSVRLFSGDGGVNSNQQTNLSGKKNERNITFSILPGIAKVKLVTGAVASTSSDGQNNPAPVFMKVDSDLIAANDEHVEIQDCTLLATATGSLGTQRARIRLSKISCVLQDGEKKLRVQKDIQGWAIDENGLPDIPGRLVSKIGQKMAQGFAAATLQEVAAAFAPTPVSYLAGVGSMQTGSTGLEKFSSGLQSGAASGMSSSLNKITDFYLKLASESTPAIYVNAGREVTVLFKGDDDIELKPYTPFSTKIQGE